jgi:Rps23 Pro-64 3,4-dihydroxylase Tpa1-like proline 4-hydroxylase
MAVANEIPTKAHALLGLSRVTWPYLSLYVAGCRQGVHNDSANGRFAFVYSLTKTQRSSIGGDTILYREGDPFRSKLRTPSADADFFERVPPRFNRLLVFDDRLPHAVDRVDGSTDPIECRLVLHGHLSEGGPIIRGRSRQTRWRINTLQSYWNSAAALPRGCSSCMVC